MHQRVRRVIGPEGVEYPVAGDRGGQRQRAAGQRLGQGDDVGTRAGLFIGEHRASAAEAGEYLVVDQQQAVAVGQPAQAAQHLGIVHQHAAGALHQRLDQDPGQLRAPALQEGVQLDLAGLVARQGDDVVLGQHAPEQAVHALFRIADRHGAEGVAVVAARTPGSGRARARPG